MSVESPSHPFVARAVPSKNGLGTAALVLGVAGLIAALSFVLLPLGLVASIVAICTGAAALTRGRAGGTANPGQAAAGLTCGILALAVTVMFSLRIGTFVANNTHVFTTFDRCIARADNRSEVANCIASFAKNVG
jgi:hypothetical protein